MRVSTKLLMNNKKILLVDDEEGIRKVLGISLADMGYQVFTAANGEEALRAFNSENPPIVLTDIKMPGMNGIELLKKIKYLNPDTEVIMITGHGDMDLAIESIKYQATDFVTKPINDDVLDIALNRALEKIQMRQQLREYTENLEALVREKSAQLVEAERQVAVGQAVEGLSTALKDIAGDLNGEFTYFNELPCFVSIHNKDLKVVAVNQLYRDRLGDRVGCNSWDVYGGSIADPEKCPTALTFNSGAGQRITGNVKYLTGSDAPVIIHTAPIKNKDCNVDLVVEIAADVTEVKRLQDKLLQSQKQYQQLFDAVPCYISVQDRDFNLVATNRQFNSDFDMAAGSHCYEVYKQRSDPCPECPVEKTFVDGQSHQAEMVVTSKDGKRYNVLINTAPLRNADGEVHQVMEMSTNITQIRELQDNLSTLGLKISSVSHGIKSLLTGLDGSIYLVDTGIAKDNSERVKEGWEAVKTIAGRVRKLVFDILYFAKDRELELETLNILNFANDVAASFESKARDGGVVFKSDFSDAKGEVELDPGVMRLALFNLLDNALDACLEAEAPKSCRIGFNVKVTQKSIVFEVTDDGIGMNTETVDKLFTLFFSSKGEKGTGMGLFIADRIVKQHGGRIAVRSTLGKGSLFSVTLPKKTPANNN